MPLNFVEQRVSSLQRRGTGASAMKDVHVPRLCVCSSVRRLASRMCLSQGCKIAGAHTFKFEGCPSTFVVVTETMPVHFGELHFPRL